MKPKSAAKCRNRRGNILLLCPEVCQGDAANWKELNTCIEQVAAYIRKSWKCRHDQMELTISGNFDSIYSIHI